MNIASPPATIALQCHPATPASVPLSLAVEIHMDQAGCTLRYRLRAPMRQVQIPPLASANGPADGLWQHTCFEAFVASDDSAAAYREFNFAPSGQWAAYRFSAERIRDTGAEQVNPTALPPLRASLGPGSLCLTARLPRTELPESGSLLLGLCAVIEEADGRLSYWAQTHPRTRPDFHHPDGRALRLTAP